MSGNGKKEMRRKYNLRMKNTGGKNNSREKGGDRENVFARKTE